MTWLWTLAARLRACLRRDDLDRDFSQELDAHLAMSADDKVRRGMSPERARQAARAELGGVTQLREAERASRGLPWLDTLALDGKLALRLLRKSWGLTLVGGLAMTTAIAILVGLLNLYQILFRSTLPLDEGERVVVLMTHDPATNGRWTVPMADFARWREALRSLENIGAFRMVERRLVTSTDPNDAGNPVSVAEMTAAGFELTRVPPLLGRPLVEDDERIGASPVVLLGHDAWVARFASAPDIVGRQVRLGDVTRTVVGVMPEGFAFPVNHQFWTPLSISLVPDPQTDDSPVFGFGRLRPGVALAEAQAELSTLGMLPPLMTSADERAAERRDVPPLLPRLLPYAFGLTGATEGFGRQFAVTFLVFASLLFLPPCANIAILVYARAVGRQEELSARQALGATRGRLVGQLFVEMLVLALGAAAVALVLIRFTGGWVGSGLRLPGGIGIPYWMNFGTVQPGTAVFALLFALLAAIIVGAVPALQATRRLVPSGLRVTGSRLGAKLGTTWTVLIVAQVAIALVVVPRAIELAWGVLRPQVLGPGLAAQEFLTAHLVDQTPEASLERVRNLLRRLADERMVIGVTASATAPGREPDLLLAVDVPSPDATRATARSTAANVDVNYVDAAFFDVFGVSRLSGRTFERDEASQAVVVNRSFARHFLGDGNPLGRRVRYVTMSAQASRVTPATWFEIVGVVEDFPANMADLRLYHPLQSAHGQSHSGPLTLSLHVRGPSADLGRRLPELAAEVDPSLLVDDVLTLDEVYRQRRRVTYVAGLMMGGVTLSVLFLSAAGIYALMSFTVTKRRREIGIRAALGAQPRLLLSGIFKGALIQLSAGAVLGMLGAYLSADFLSIVAAGGREVPGVVPAAAVLLTLVGLIATVGPARRALLISPTEALKEGD